jgi:transposase
MSTTAILGIDMAKAKFDVCLLHRGKSYQRTFANHLAGFAQLQDWLHKRGASPVHACLESTGIYGDELALYLHAAGHVVSIVNPVRIKGFAQSELARNKTDRADAALIARFCQQQQPDAWTPPAPEIRELRALVRRLDDVQQMLGQEQNRLDNALRSDAIRDSIQQVIAVLEEQSADLKQQIHAHFDQHPHLRQQRDLITSIPGLAELSAARLIAEYRDLAAYEHARQLPAQAGLTPRQFRSGSSVQARTRLSKIGSARLRKALYMPAIVAMRCNPIIQTFVARLRRRGKPTMSIIGAVMRKLLHLVYGVVKHGQPFDPHYLADTP